ncbi:hypothetical protein CB1_064113013 [Camelus ferus]|nr:hypothetical protein CB1_064113013 [Camelus ferus]
MQVPDSVASVRELRPQGSEIAPSVEGGQCLQEDETPVLADLGQMQLDPRLKIFGCDEIARGPGDGAAHKDLTPEVLEKDQSAQLPAMGWPPPSICGMSERRGQDQKPSNTWTPGESWVCTRAGERGRGRRICPEQEEGRMTAHLSIANARHRLQQRGDEHPQIPGEQKGPNAFRKHRAPCKAVQADRVLEVGMWRRDQEKAEEPLDCWMNWCCQRPISKTRLKTADNTCDPMADKFKAACVAAVSRCARPPKPQSSPSQRVALLWCAQSISHLVTTPGTGSSSGSGEVDPGEVAPDGLCSTILSSISLAPSQKAPLPALAEVIALGHLPHPCIVLFTTASASAAATLWMYLSDPRL